MTASLFSGSFTLICGPEVRSIAACGPATSAQEFLDRTRLETLCENPGFRVAAAVVIPVPSTTLKEAGYVRAA